MAKTPTHILHYGGQQFRIIDDGELLSSGGFTGPYLVAVDLESGGTLDVVLQPGVAVALEEIVQKPKTEARNIVS